MIGAVHSSAIPVSSPVRHVEAVPSADSVVQHQAAVSTGAASGHLTGGKLLSPPNLLAAQSVKETARGDSSCDSGSKKSSCNGQLSDAEKAQVEKLKARDREVRAHEHAHASTGGDLAGAPSYSFQKGPDGQQYAVGGEVKIDAAPVKNDPEATITKMQRVIAAALAPAQPSGQDRAVAAQARANLAQAQSEALAQGHKGDQGNGDAPQPQIISITI